MKEEIYIERAGKRVAKLTPVDALGASTIPKGKRDFRKAAGLDREVWEGIDAEEYVKKERESWG